MIVAINPSGGGSDKGLSGNGIVEKDYTLNLSNKINERLKSMGIKTYMLRDDDSTISYEKRLDNLKKHAGDEDVLLLSNTLNNNNGIDIIYALRDTSKLAEKVSEALDYFNSTKYYQLRYPSNTKLDYYYITRETPDYETLIIRYGNPKNSKDSNTLKQIDDIADAIANVIGNYVGVSKPVEKGNVYIVKSGDSFFMSKRYLDTLIKIEHRI